MNGDLWWMVVRDAAEYTHLNCKFQIYSYSDGSELKVVIPNVSRVLHPRTLPYQREIGAYRIDLKSSRMRLSRHSLRVIYSKSKNVVESDFIPLDGRSTSDSVRRQYRLNETGFPLARIVTNRLVSFLFSNFFFLLEICRANQLHNCVLEWHAKLNLLCAR